MLVNQAILREGTNFLKRCLTSQARAQPLSLDRPCRVSKGSAWRVHSLSPPCCSRERRATEGGQGGVSADVRAASKRTCRLTVIEAGDNSIVCSFEWQITRAEWAARLRPVKS